MHYLKCEHCGFLNLVENEFLVFCKQCRKKLPSNYSDWKKLHADKTFEDYKKVVCLYQESQAQNQSENAPKKAPWTKRIRLRAIIFILLLASAGGLGVFMMREYVEVNPKAWLAKVVQRISFKESDTSNWIDFEPIGKEYSLRMPFEPQTEEMAVSSPVGEVKVTVYTCTPQAGQEDNLMYRLIVSEYPITEEEASSIPQTEIDGLFELAIEQFVAGGEARLLSSENSDFEEFPGQEAVLELNEGLSLAKLRLYFIQNKMFVLQIITLPGNLNNRSTTYYFNSFRYGKNI